jgi:hypothetical protein
MAVQYAFGKIVTNGLALNVDAADPTSYTSGSTSWISVVNRSLTGSIISCSYTSDFKGGIVFNNQSASVSFPTSVANYGTGSFTVEMAFRPDSINGIHYLISKNSGSFPNWGVYLSGSNGSGKLFSSYNISSTVSCSVSSSTTFVTGSNYFVDVQFIPNNTVINININNSGYIDSIARANGTGSLTTTGSLFLGNLTVSSSQAFSGSVYNTKIYSTQVDGFQNYRSQYSRLGGVLPPRPLSVEALIVAGGGGAGSISGAGAGGLRYAVVPIQVGSYSVFVGDGGAGAPSNTISGSNGQTSSFANIVAAGGGFGGNFPSGNGGSGGSGGGGGTGGISGSGNIPSTDPSQGNNGGGAAGSGNPGGSGGGGAGQVGFTAAITNGNGGSGSFITSFSSIGGSPAGWFAGGGAGAGGGGYSGGYGGGGNPLQPGTANTGGGGGGNYGNSGNKGGSGIVAIRYPGTPAATGGTITQSGGYTYHTFTATGSSTFTVL